MIALWKLLKKWLKGPTLKDQLSMAEGPLGHVGLSGSFMTVIAEGNKSFVYLQWEMELLLIYHEKKNYILHFCNKEHET